MKSEEIKSGDFLKDIDFEIIIRSGGTDLIELTKIQKALTAYLVQLVDCKIVTTETEMKLRTTLEGKLVTLKSYLSID